MVATAVTTYPESVAFNWLGGSLRQRNGFCICFSEAKRIHFGEKSREKTKGITTNKPRKKCRNRSRSLSLDSPNRKRAEG